MDGARLRYFVHLPNHCPVQFSGQPPNKLDISILNLCLSLSTLPNAVDRQNPTDPGVATEPTIPFVLEGSFEIANFAPLCEQSSVDPRRSDLHCWAYDDENSARTKPALPKQS